ncbi:uncharacterized protein F5Z01DRAFT_645577 [Emericellopsis atlantica]|uniref:Uncharacterized protein n=1 Tax=Emericellopsis atlantica TaxID=2614577 RepID=A0A9P7ZV20_9HYPO|nr:uncharacterized protein F5Z01DRAFT_645577 [Emericellopsis atlantica]KAG9258287.1 hypothetical protein F5Z01DRAFT_645577 [Emericellopsis atlantica]
MHIILTGTGLVGACALDFLLQEDAVTRVTIISRRAVPQAEGHDKVTVLIQEDLGRYSPETLQRLSGAHGCIWTVGPPQASVTRAEYEAAHIDLPVAAAKSFATLNDKFNFVYVSHDQIHTPNSRWVFFLDVKSQAEEVLFQLHHDTSKRLPLVERPGKPLPHEEALPSLRIYCARPMLIDYRKHEAVKPWLKPLTLGKKWSNWVGLPVYSFFGMTSMIGDSRELGRALVDLSCGDGEDIHVEGVSPEGRCLGVVGTRNWCKERKPLKASGGK